MSNDLNIIPSFKDSLFNDSLKGILKDFIELGIDSVMNDGLAKDIPIVGTLVSIGKLGANIRDRNLLKQTLVFITTFNDQTILEDKLNKYKEKINNDPKKAETELGRVIILLNANIDDIKSELLARLYSSYVNEVIEWNKFCELSDILNRIFITDIEMFLNFNIGENYNTSVYPLYQVNRLISIGLLLIPGVTWNDQQTGNKTFTISEVGKIFTEIIQ